MIRRFLSDISGNFAMMTSIALVPIMGAVALGIDYAEMSRQRQDTLNALDAAGIATAREILSGSGKDETEIRDYAKEFFETNLGSVDPANATLNIVLPRNTTGGGTLKLSADLKYQPYFFTAFAQLMGKTSADGTTTLDFGAQSEVRLKNTIEVALVLDNSGSMSEYGKGSGKTRLALLKEASKQLIETLGKQAEMLQQVEKPVQFALVPFAASVNVGPTPDGSDESRPWLDIFGMSPVHHENFDWRTLQSPRSAEKVAGVWYKRGSAWGNTENDPLTRFSLYKDIKKEKTRTGALEAYTSWAGCVEARPAPLDSNDEPASTGRPTTLFVPMFAPDEPGNVWLDTDGDGQNDRSSTSYGYSNNWWTDADDRDKPKPRQRDGRKYFQIKPYGSKSAGTGPNFSCTTKPITPLQDVTTLAGRTKIFAAIDSMKASGNTNVPEGTAWGWRVLSSGEPFTEGRPESEQGNDKIVIVLTDGANTYSAAGDDAAENKSTYAAYGYTGQDYDGTGVTRMFMGTTNAVSKSDHRSANFQKALDEHLQTVCQNAKTAGIMMITVSLDLDTSKNADKKAIEALRACASESRYSTGTDGKPMKLYFEATGADLAKTFEKIANELSNLRIVG
jgi:Flp pilus assembly protein TadG